jgi:hypothetical protein
MCRRIDCAKCGKPTFAGCGMHVEQVLGNVPPAQRCRCREERATTETTAAGAKGFFSRLKDRMGK